MDKSTVRPGTGIGDLKFGATMEDCEAYFGPADQRDESKSGIDTTIRLSWGEQLACWFYSEDDFRLGSIQLEHPDALLAGLKLMGRARAEVIQLLASSFGQPSLEDMSVIEFPDYWLASYDAKCLNLWFDEGQLCAIQWGYLLDESEDVAWPS